MVKPNPLKVGLVFDDSLDSSAGVAQYVKTLGAWLSGQGCQVRYLVGQTRAREHAGDKIYSLARNQTVYFNGNKLSMPLWTHKAEIKQVLAQERFDVLHVMMPDSPFFGQRVVKLAGPNTAVVGTFHIFPSGPLSQFGARLLRLMYGWSLGRFDEIVSVSPVAARFARRAFGLDTRVIPNPVEIHRFAGAKPAFRKRGVKNIVFLGKLVKRKGCAQLIDAFWLLSQSRQNVQLLIAGEGPGRSRLETKVAALGLKKQVKFLGYINEADKPGLLAGADIACFPSLYGESFGIVLLEAMAAGARVVLGGNNPGYKSVLHDRPEMLINPKNSRHFANRLSELLDDEKLARQLSRWQKTKVEHYDINVVGNQIIELYNRAIARPAKLGHNIGHEL